MSKISIHPAVRTSLERNLLPERDAAVLTEMIDGYYKRRVGAKRHNLRAFNRDVAIIYDFVHFTESAPWYWTENDFDNWCHEIGITRKLAVSTQRHYQGVIRSFLTYLSENVKFCNDVRRLYGTEIVQICTAENCIPHVVERELARERRALSHEEIHKLFKAIDNQIVIAANSASKDLWPLQRDKALFFTIYVGGLRASEALGLNMGSFQPNPLVPAFGSYGFISVWGKGSRGSGPKHRTVPVDHTDLPPLLDWYVNSVRPRFLVNADPNEEALFLSERGLRLSLSSLEYRFQHAIEIAELTGKGFTPHSLRHSSVTHESYRLSLEAVRRKHGHVYAATTQLYTHISDEFVNEEMNLVINKQLEMAGDDENE